MKTLRSLQRRRQQVAAKVSAEEAGARYDALGRGKWNEDSVWGAFLALDAYLMREFVRRVHREGRNRERKRTRSDPPLPGWVGPTYVFCQVMIAGAGAMEVELPPIGGFIGFMVRRDLVWVAQELIFSESIANVVRRLEEVRGTKAGTEIESLIEEWHSKYPPHEDREQRAFFEGTRRFFHMKGWGEPTARPLALLAASRGIEPIDQGLNLARKHWDERLGRWRRDMDRLDPNWREFTDFVQGFCASSPPA